MQRRTFLALSATALTGALPVIAKDAGDTARALAAIETHSGGRLGVYARDIGKGRAIAYRARERFPMCSTFKVLAVAAVLKRVDEGRERLSRSIAFGKADLLAYAPVTSAHVSTGRMTVGELCAAAIALSDNTAANLLLRSIGGPSAVTAFVRAYPMDDPTTRLDRIEPALNSAIPGDARDTTTPARMAHDLAMLLTTNAVLSTASSRTLERWMHDCKTGVHSLRAGGPPEWYAADKTGSGAHGTANDVAIFHPAQRSPIIIAAYLTGATVLNEDERNAVLADIGRVVTNELS